MVAIPRTLLSTPDQSTTDDRVAVLLMGYGEVESYEDFANYNEQALNLLTAKFAPVPTWIYPPLAKLLALFDRHEWDHQHDHFISPHNSIFERQREGIERHLQAKWGKRVSVFKAFNFCAPYLPQQVLAEIQSQGFTKLLIYPLLVVDSIFTSGIAVEQVNKALAQTFTGEDNHWLKSTRYMPSFYNQPDYIELLARQVTNKIQQHLAVAHLPSQTGIVLMNHGCPHKAKGFTSGITESQLLYDAVRERLIYNYPLISIGWLNHDTPMIEWTQPNVTLAAQNLMDLGATAVVFMPIGFVTENHETLLDVEHIISHLRRKRPDVTYVQMPCVNDNDDFAAMAAGWVDGLITDLIGEQGTVVHPSQRALLAEDFSGHHHDSAHNGHHHHHGHHHDEHHHNGHHGGDQGHSQEHHHAHHHH
ncbi:ferrochelatase [Adonisia turfae]|uniref:coproporphyrin ferrochelatase n=1 Tax=Adonisia turfae CCMR0081 TaxID=2292702 RepID=A0A6M0RSY0_9CYAN|nr:ferrochelatase [Adonisia turfae]NEZ59347.1 ferrochelatase [Adonisia turfae CCMR0081]